MSELRWNPLREEWIITATNRQSRTFMPPPDYCPLCPTKPNGFPTEVPEKEYELAVLENRFPSLRREPDIPTIAPNEVFAVRENIGVCEVVLYTDNHNTTLAQMPVNRIRNLIDVWADRYLDLAALPYVHYVYIFENKGKEIGVTLSHPHGQIYGYPFIPPFVEKELRATQAHRERTGHCLSCDILSEEHTAEKRIIYENNVMTAVVPFYARWPYETHIVARRHVAHIAALSGEERDSLAIFLKSLLVTYDDLFERSFPYIMALHQSPTDGAEHENSHFRIEFYPPLRDAKKLKYLSGSETGAGVFINDTVPEVTAGQLRALWQKLPLSASHLGS